MKTLIAIVLTVLVMTIVLWTYSEILKRSVPEAPHTIVLKSDKVFTEKFLFELMKKYPDQISTAQYSKDTSIPALLESFLIVSIAAIALILPFLGIRKLLDHKIKKRNSEPEDSLDSVLPPEI